LKKFLSNNDVIRIIDIYDNYKNKYFPKILDYSSDSENPYIEFEWIEGSQIDDVSLQEAFYQLGLMHNQFKFEDKNPGFLTICHGDFHKNNIIQNNSGIYFIDITYIHKGWNYSDLCYLDLFNFFPKEKYPWYIKQSGCFEAYLEAIKENCNEEEKEILKNKITLYMLEFNIRNGIKNCLNVDYEKELLEKLKLQTKRL
jgi:tRNA A-37 threonylcarbamoyl transferase component Bud32